ncbi:GntR family transcriptional regulator [Curvibacter gracilis]|uniref:GntR family transcriptional regulator n=1 Tax=Curvibacter gracilis TaxID=230310 RepID=UPI000484E801|nr:GntR family transcriptional regulator [Curvibacter gracilis]
MKAPISSIRRERGSGVFNTLREMAISCQLKPGERLSEIELAARLGVSRTPVREALNRLVTEGFLQPCSRGFMRRPLDVQETLDLYEARVAVERECLRLALLRGTPEQLDEAQTFLNHSRAVSVDTPMAELVALDEAFHRRLAAMSGNAELQRMLASLNDRIRFLRWIDMEHVGRDSTQQEHQAILEALRRRDASAAEQHLSDHIVLRRDQIAEAIRLTLARLEAA